MTIARGELVALLEEDPRTRLAWRVVVVCGASATIEPAWGPPDAERRVVLVRSLELLPAFRP